MSCASRFAFAATMAFVLNLFGATAQAQTRDRFSATFEQLGRASNLSANAFEANGAHRFFLDADGASLLTAGLQYRGVQIDFDGLGQRRLYSLVPQISLAQIIDDRHSLIVYARPGFFGDFSSDFGRSFRLEGGALVTRVIDDKLTMGIGAARGSNFGRDLVVPLLQVLWLPTPTIMVDAILPVKAEAWYLPSKAWEFGALFNIVGSLYRFDDPSFGLQASQIGFANMNLGLGARRNLHGSAYASAEIGWTVSRRLEFANGRDSVQENVPNGVPYGRVGYNWRF